MSQRFTTTPDHKHKYFALQVRNVDRFTEMQLGTDGMFLCMFLSKLVDALYCYNWPLQYQYFKGNPQSTVKDNFASKICPFSKEQCVRKICTDLALVLHSH